MVFNFAEFIHEIRKINPTRKLKAFTASIISLELGIYPVQWKAFRISYSCVTSFILGWLERKSCHICEWITESHSLWLNSNGSCSETHIWLAQCEPHADRDWYVWPGKVGILFCWMILSEVSQCMEKLRTSLREFEVLYDSQKLFCTNCRSDTAW